MEQVYCTVLLSVKKKKFGFELFLDTNYIDKILGTIPVLGRWRISLERIYSGSNIEFFLLGLCYHTSTWRYSG